jgi:hypothetical protein
MRSRQPDLVDRWPGDPPRYRHYDFELPTDARFLTAHREPVRPMELDFDYVLDMHSIFVQSGTPCPGCGVCRKDLR